MTPKEKALDLVHKFAIENKYYERAQQCALISVGEILKVIEDNCLEYEDDYWEQVKQEIEKL